MRNSLEKQIGFDIATVVVLAVSASTGYRMFHGEVLSLETVLNLFGVAIALGVIFWTLLLIRLRKRITHPLRKISDHVEDMSMGLFEKWEYPVLHSEMDRITDSMNQVANLDNQLQIPWRVLSFDIAPHFTRLRSHEDLPESLQADLEETWDHLRRMDVAIMGAFSPSPHFTIPRNVPCDKRFKDQPKLVQPMDRLTVEELRRLPAQFSESSLQESVALPPDVSEGCA